jgi:hypothetical protein
VRWPNIFTFSSIDYFASLNFAIDQQPSTPESIEYNGLQYYLDTSSSVRRTEEYFSSQKSEWDRAQDADAGIEAISETSLDLESKEKTSECLVSRLVRCYYRY